MRSTLTALILLTLSGAAPAAEPYHLIPGAVPLDSGPDGNTIVFDAPKGLIVFDTGRHPEHAQKILDYAKVRHRPIAAIINSHWHLDHTTGNWDIRQAYPHVAVYASNALEGALATFLKTSRADTDKMLADPKTPAVVRDQLLRGRAVIDHPERIRPNHIVAKSGALTIAGRRFDVHLARFAATVLFLLKMAETDRSLKAWALGLPPLMLLVAFLMMSTVRYPSGKKAVGRNARRSEGPI